MILHKIAAAIQLGGTLLAVPAGLVGLYSAYQTNFSTEASCRTLRTAILSTLDKNLDAPAKRALVHKDMTEFEQRCALTDPDAKAVFAAIDHTILFAVDPDAKAATHPVRFTPPRPFQARPGDHPLQHLFERLRQRPFGT